MQKVSKQSLAMIALSILLAISIALTFTFAALTESKTAKGTITFSAGGSVTWADNNEKKNETMVTITNGSLTLNLTDANFVIEADGRSATLNIATKEYLQGCVLTFDNTSNSVMKTKITRADELGDANVYTGLYKGEDKFTDVAAGAKATKTAVNLFGGLTISGSDEASIAGVTGVKTTYTAYFDYKG